jgi:hypothetical protein
MPVPPLPPGFDQVGTRTFSFYPAIIGVEYNEWLYRSATWSEVLVVNAKDGLEVWIPRLYIGQFSRIEEPVVIVGLTKELEYKGGQVWPYVRRIIEMPRAVNDTYRPTIQESVPQPASVVGIRTESGAESRIWRLLVGALAVGIAACLVIITVLRSDRDGSRIKYSPVVQSDLGLEAQDDFHAVVRKLGSPAEDRWRSEAGERQYRVLRYPDRGISVILMGADRATALYIGSVDPEGRPVHAITLPGPGGKNAYSILRSLRVN